jgi:hypothetical protein
VVTEQTLADLFPDAVAAYRRSVADVDYVRGLWVDAGRPLVADHGNGSAGIHPLLRAVQESEVLANRLRGELELSPRSAKSVIRRGPGRPTGAASAPDRAPAKVTCVASRTRASCRTTGSPRHAPTASGGELVSARDIGCAQSEPAHPSRRAPGAVGDWPGRRSKLRAARPSSRGDGARAARLGVPDAVLPRHLIWSRLMRRGGWLRR